MIRRIHSLMVLMMSGAMVASPGIVGAERESTRPTTTTSAATEMYALIVGGINKDPEQQQAKDRAIIKLRKMLGGEGNVPADHVRVLVDSSSLVSDPSGPSTAENLRKEIDRLAKALTTSDTFIFYYVGQANVVGGTLRVNLPGPDVTQDELASLIAQVPASRQLIVVDCPGAGLAAAALAKLDRIVICGSRSDQHYSTRFSEFFVPALGDAEADVNADGRISIVEALRLAAERLDRLYREQDLLKTETPLLEDDGDAVPSEQPWLFPENKKDGRRASEFFLGPSPDGKG